MKEAYTVWVCNKDRFWTIVLETHNYREMREVVQELFKTLKPYEICIDSFRPA